MNFLSVDFVSTRKMLSSSPVSLEECHSDLSLFDLIPHRQVSGQLVP